MKEHKYEAIARTLENQIRQGVFKPGEKVPTELALVQAYSVSRQTIRQAISLLEKRGLLIQRQGSGTYVEADYSRVVQRHAKTATIAVVPCFMSNYIFPSIMRGIEEIVSSAGYSVRLSPTQHRVDRERVILQQLLENPVDGLIVEGVKTCMPNPNIPLYRELQRMGMPIVFFNTIYPELDDVVLVSMDDFSVVRDGVKLLVENGHKKIAGIFRWDDRQGLDRYAGFNAGLLDAALPLNDNFVSWYGTGDLDESNPERIAPVIDRKWLASVVENVTAFVCYNDTAATSLFQALECDFPGTAERYAVVSFDASVYYEMSSRSYVSYPHKKVAFGKNAAIKLLKMINGEQQESEKMQWGKPEKETF